MRKKIDLEEESALVHREGMYLQLFADRLQIWFEILLPYKRNFLAIAELYLFASEESWLIKDSWVLWTV